MNTALDIAAAGAIGVEIPAAARNGILPRSYTWIVNAAAPAAARLEATAAQGNPPPAERARRLVEITPRFQIGDAVVLQAAPRAFPIGRPDDVHGLIVDSLQICNFERLPHVRVGCRTTTGWGHYESCQDSFHKEN